MTSQPSPRPRFPWGKALFSLLLCVACVGGGIAAMMALAGMKQQPPRRKEVEKVYSIEAFQVEQADLQEVITAFGTTRPNREVTIDAQVAGEIVAVHGRQPNEREPSISSNGLKVGQRVRGPDPVNPGGENSLDPGAQERYSGDLLLQIDDATYQQKVAQAQNQINEDSAELGRLRQEQKNNDRVLAKVTSDYKIYEQEYERVKRLHERKIATDGELAAAKLELARYEDAKIQRENDRDLFPNRIELLEKRILTHETARELARLDLARTDVRPPFSGVISEVMVELGKYVNVGEPLFRLTDTTEIEIPLALTLQNYARIERQLLAGERPRVELSENETAPKRWEGYVVRRAPEADVATRTVNVYVHVDNDGPENSSQPIDLLPSVFVHARIDGPVIKRTIVVPRDVIRDGKLFVIANLQPVTSTKGKTDEVDRIQVSESQSAIGELLEGIVEEREVKVERALRNLAIVSAGLKPGDLVAVTNLDVIHTGAKVRIETRFSLDAAIEEQGANKALRRYDANGTLAGGPSADDRSPVE